MRTGFPVHATMLEKEESAHLVVLGDHHVGIFAEVELQGGLVHAQVVDVEDLRRCTHSTWLLVRICSSSSATCIDTAEAHGGALC